MKSRVLLSTGSFLLLLLVGCATPQTRIERYPEIFASFPPEVRQDVRQGIVRLGFSTDMVSLAIGRPDHIQKRVDEAGDATVWRYTAYRWRHRPHRWPYRGPWWHDSFYWEDRQEYDVLRVEFRGDKVVALEHFER